MGEIPAAPDDVFIDWNFYDPSIDHTEDIEPLIDIHYREVDRLLREAEKRGADETFDDTVIKEILETWNKSHANVQD